MAMKSSPKRTNWLYTFSVTLSISASSLYAAPTTQAAFSTLTNNYSKALQKIDTEYRPEVEKLNKQYLRSLTKIDESVKANGDLQGLIKVRDERLRFEEEKTVPPQPTTVQHKLIAKAQAGYRRALETVENETNKKLVLLTGQYIKRLESIKKQLVAEANIEDALAVVEEIKKAKEKYASTKSLIKKRVAQHSSSPASSLALVPQPGQEMAIDLGKGIKLEMVWIPPGSFQMGSPDDEEGRKEDEGPVHKVTISKGFWMGKYEVTQEQYQQVAGTKPSKYKSERNPVEQVRWDDCLKFVEKLNAKAKGAEFRLPTEAEWEYACRAGTTTRYYTGNNESGLAKAGWHDKNSKKQTHAVGQKEPNKWGLYDMYGNVWEWCSDRYGEYPEEPQVDSQGPSQTRIKN